MKRCGPAAGDGLAEGVRNILADGNGLPAVAQGLLGVAEVPADAGQKRVAIRGTIEREAGRCGAAPFRIIKRYALLQMCPRGDQFGRPEQFTAHLEMGVGKKFQVL
jgi:hypothetical protein